MKGKTKHAANNNTVCNRRNRKEGGLEINRTVLVCVSDLCFCVVVCVCVCGWGAGGLTTTTKTFLKISQSEKGVHFLHLHDITAEQLHHEPPTLPSSFPPSICKRRLLAHNLLPQKQLIQDCDSPLAACAGVYTCVFNLPGCSTIGVQLSVNSVCSRSRY